MTKGKIIFVALLLATGAFFLWNPTPHTQESPKLKSGYRPEDVVAGARDVIDQIEKDTTGKVNDFIEDQKKQIAKTLTGNQEAEVRVTPKQPGPNDLQLKVIMVDLSKENNLLLNLKRGKKVFLSFKNTKAGYCLYINDAKYNIAEGQSLELEFLSADTFSIKTNLCDLNYSEHGKFIVE